MLSKWILLGIIYHQTADKISNQKYYFRMESRKMIVFLQVRIEGVPTVSIECCRVC